MFTNRFNFVHNSLTIPHHLTSNTRPTHLQHNYNTHIADPPLFLSTILKRGSADRLLGALTMTMSLQQRLKLEVYRDTLCMAQIDFDLSEDIEQCLISNDVKEYDKVKAVVLERFSENTRFGHLCTIQMLATGLLEKPFIKPYDTELVLDKVAANQAADAAWALYTTHLEKNVEGFDKEIFRMVWTYNHDRDGKTLHNLRAKKLNVDGPADPKEAARIMQRGEVLTKLETEFWEFSKHLKMARSSATGRGTCRVHVI